MTTIAILGPNDPFANKAVILYNAAQKQISSISYHPGVREIFRAVGTTCDFGIVPIETMIDGHTIPVLELLLQGNCTIIDELTVPATYGYITHSATTTPQTVFMTYRAEHECADFISMVNNVTLQHVGNIDTAIANVNSQPHSAALIPTSAIDRDGSYHVVNPNVSDYPGNIIRYIVLAEQEQPFIPDRQYKTSMVLLETVDKPGVLGNILAAFSTRSINLMSIISRPTREHFGTYHFFVDCSGYVLSSEIQGALTSINKFGHVKLLGSYPAIDLHPEVETPALPQSVPSMDTNPLRPDTQKPRITIAAGNGPYRNTLDALANFNLAPVYGKKILLKPNIGRVAEPYSGIVTNPQVVAAAIDAFRAAGAEVAIGESPITGVNMEQAFEKSGISFIAHERNCPIIDMDKRNPVEIAVKEGSVISSLTLCADIFDYDFIVSIPVMKMHMHTTVTLSVKNMKGCLWGRSKVKLHMLPRLPFSEDKSLNIAIADMSSVLKPHLVIIDGTVGMEGLGPSSGEPKPLDMVIIGNDALATDAVACTIMGVSPAKVPHLRIAAERGYGSIDPDDAHVTNPDWHSLCQPFVPVPQNITMEYPRVKILDEQSCSACQSTVMLFMKRYGDVLGNYFPNNKPITIAIGKGHKGVPVSTICIGNCTRRYRDAGVYVPGCPPVASSIITALDKQNQNQVP